MDRPKNTTIACAVAIAAGVLMTGMALTTCSSGGSWSAEKTDALLDGEATAVSVMSY